MPDGARPGPTRAEVFTDIEGPIAVYSAREAKPALWRCLVTFCNSCGTQLEGNAKFCTKCGTTVPASGVQPAASPAAAGRPAQSSSGLKIVLIVVGVLIGLGILGTAVSAFMAWRFARNVRIESRNGKVEVRTPLGSVVSTDNPDEAARNLGVDVYPGASAVKGSAASVSMGGTHNVAAEFVTDDPPAKVADFYNKKFPRATVSQSEGDHYAIVSMGDKGMITIGIEPEEGKTHIKIATVTGKGFGEGETTN